MSELPCDPDLFDLLVCPESHAPLKYVDGRLVSGDTLFLDGCGRTDLPGSDSDQMYESLTTRLARFSDDTVLYPGHLYSPEPSAGLGAIRQNNYVFRLRTPEQWMTMFGS